MLYLSYVLKSGLRLAVKYFHIVAFVFSLNKRILMLLSPLVLSLSTTSLVPSQPELQTFRKKNNNNSLLKIRIKEKQWMPGFLSACICVFTQIVEMPLASGNMDSECG